VNERRRAQRLARNLGLSENRLYADLIQEGLLMREQMTYLEKLRSMRVLASEGLALLDLAPDVPPSVEDRPPGPRRRTPGQRRAGLEARATR
jgi:hypothetical protein